MISKQQKTWLPWCGCGREVELIAGWLVALLGLADVVLLSGGGNWKLMLIFFPNVQMFSVNIQWLFSVKMFTMLDLHLILMILCNFVHLPWVMTQFSGYGVDITFGSSLGDWR